MPRGIGVPGPQQVQQNFVTLLSQKGVSRKTVLNVLGILSSMMGTAKSWGYCTQAITTGELALPASGSLLISRALRIRFIGSNPDNAPERSSKACVSTHGSDLALVAQGWRRRG